MVIEAVSARPVEASIATMRKVPAVRSAVNWPFDDTVPPVAENRTVAAMLSLEPCPGDQ
jgi:hypothetical protein